MPVVNGVSENGDVTKPLMAPTTTIEMAPIEITTDKRTRFQVNKVTPPENSDKSIQITVAEDQDDEEREVDDNLLSVNDRTRLNSDAASNTDTKYAKSFRHFTREALPRLDNYRNIMSIQAAYRPTLDELHNATLPNKAGNTLNSNTKNPTEEKQQVKFGWIQGVLVRCLLNIWGVMLFLRLSWVVGQAGVGEACLLILTTTAVTTITALSMSAISTNGVIKGGGTYYMISRSLGPEFGGSIGLIFSLANAVACAMYVVGFCESMTDLLGSFGLTIIDGDVQDVRIIGSITIVLLTVLVVVGMEWEAKTQLGLLVILLIAIVDFLIGSFIGPSDESKSKGFMGYNLTLLKQNFFSDYREAEGVEHSFFSVFAIFFPAATGILAGANISGDLKDPQSAIPKGTLLAIVVTTASYLIMALVAGWTMARDATGNLEDFYNGTFLNCTPGECQYGLQNSFQVIELVSWVGPIIYAGCFAATLSSALASLVSAPKVFQALCKDKLYPYIEWFAKGYGQNNEPVRGYVLTFVIAMAFILIGELNLIAPLISNFFLAAYTLINFSTFHASLAKPVGWRPTFKYYNMWLSLLGAVLCIGVMFLISWWTALLTLSVVVALYLIVAYQKPDVNWGSTTQAQTYKNALNSVQQLNSVEDHVKNFAPQILVLSGMPSARPPLIDFAYLLTKTHSLLICGDIKENHLSQRVRTVLNYKANSWLKAHKVKAFYALVDGVNFDEGAKAMLQASGIGKLKPNILLMGYKSDWQKCSKEVLDMYFEILHKSLDMHLSVGILRLQDGLDYSNVIQLDEDGQINEQSLLQMRTRNNSTESIPRNQSYTQMSQASSASDISAPGSPMVQNKQSVNPSPNADTDSISIKKKKQSNQGSKSDVYQSKSSSDFPKDVMNQMHIFQRKQRKGTIDVWWLYDDGGLTLLLPYIISNRRNWANCKLRVFALANKQDELELEHRNMASLLAKFRIDYSDLRVIPDITRKPQDSTQAFFDGLISELTKPEFGDDTETAPIPESELMAMKEKTNRHLRLRELLLEHSHDASLVVMTLPMPRKNMVTAPLYMSWLELLTKDMPPFLLVRGNQTSVLTFYS